MAPCNAPLHNADARVWLDSRDQPFGRPHLQGLDPDVGRHRADNSIEAGLGDEVMVDQAVTEHA